jgi:hypothetical protein
MSQEELEKLEKKGVIGSSPSPEVQARIPRSLPKTQMKIEED